MELNFNKEDFESIEFSFIFLNQTSGTECRDSVNIEMEQVGKQYLTLTIPKNECAIGHTLQLVMFRGAVPHFPKKLPKIQNMKKRHFDVIGKVISKAVLEENDKKVVIELKFSQYDQELWDETRSIFEKKQKKM